MKIRSISIAAILMPAAISAASIEYDFTAGDGVANTNDFGSGVTVGDFTLTSGGGTAFNGVVHTTGDPDGGTNSKARIGARKASQGGAAMSFVVTVPSTSTMSLTGLAFEQGLDFNGADMTPLLNLTIDVGATEVFNSNLNNIGTQTDEGFAFSDDNVDLSGVTALQAVSDTTVTFTFDFTQEERANGVDVIANTMDDVVLTGTASASSDSDGDGLDDAYEQTIIDFDAGDAVDGLEDVMGTGAAPAVTDFDSDGSNDADELTNGTIATNPDTDGDGFYDGAETNDGTFVSYDYVTNTGATGSDPLDDDTDGDTLLDGVESGTGIFVDASDTGTDPNLANTDGSAQDTMDDNVEIANGLDPNSDAPPNGDFDDFDMDGLLNYEEIEIFGTVATVADTDSDNLSDGVEVDTTLTDPLLADTDGDGLEDGEEDLNADGFVDPGESDPFLKNSDGDFYDDATEVAEGSDPLEASSIPGFAIFSSGFDANTGAVVLAANTDNTSGSATLGVTWGNRPSVTAISDLTAISVGDSNGGVPVGGFVQLQNGTAELAGPDNVYLSRNHNQDTDRTTSQRGYSFDFTVDTSIDLGRLVIRSGHANNQGGNQAFTSELYYELSGGTLASPVAAAGIVDYSGTQTHYDVGFSLLGTTIGAGNYSLRVYQSNMTAGGAYAIYDGISLEDSTVLPPATTPKIITSGFNGASYEIEVTDLDPATNYVMVRSEDLVDGFPTVVDGPRTPADDGTPETDVFSDPAPAGDKGFYRLEAGPSIELP